MASLVNPYFASKFSNSLEQTLYQNLATEAIQILGFSAYYLPRHAQKIDPILGEDNLTKFELAIPIEMMIEDVNGWRNDSEIISKFGLEIRNDMTFLVSKPRWNDEVGKLFDGVNQDYVAPVADNPLTPENEFVAEVLANPEANFDVLVPTRPQEGDLIWEPLSKALLEIKFVEHEDQFYPLGTNYYYKLKCEYFHYSSEEMATGITDIDVFNAKSNDLLDYQLLLEDGSLLLQEDGFSLLQDLNTDIGTAFAENNDFKSNSKDIGWSSNDPFGEF